MNETLKRIHDYLIATGAKEKDLLFMDTQSVYLSMEISEYAHRNQRRENGEEYAEHPARCLKRYRKMVGIKENDPFCIDKDLMEEHGIPFDGVQELCLLHDVVEDTELSFEDVQGIFYDCGFKTYFDLYLKDPLRRITHDKSVGYEEYIGIVLQNPISAIVKMMDLQDNLQVLDLVELNESTYDRAIGYLQYIYMINHVYHFVENIQAYLKEFKANQGAD